MLWARKSKGFTIIELLIVVVVIAILAAITIVAYNGVISRARTSTVQSELATAARTLEAYKVSNGSETYPETLALAQLSSSSTTTMKYFANNTTTPRSFCLNGTNGAISYIATNDNLTPRTGSCTITNLVKNPNFSLDTNGWNTGGYGNGAVATATRTAGLGPSGEYAMRTQWTTAATSAGHSSSMNVNTPLVAGEVYTASVWVRSNQPVTTAMVRLTYGSTTVESSLRTLTSNAWTRVSVTFTVAQDASSINIQARLNDLYGTSNGLTFDATDYLLTRGDALYTYADGNSAGWSWNGTAGASTSSGPAL